MPSMDLLFRFIGVDGGAGAEFDRMGMKASGLASKMEVSSAAISKAAGATLLAGGAVAAVSVKMAADFQTATTRIRTQADASNKQVATLSKGFLSMAGDVASTPAALADAGYHIASIGQGSLKTAQQLRILKIAAEGAKIGGANLTDVTNALDAAVVSGIKGVHNYSQTMGVLNSTVGAGDMSMQDMADAFGPLGAVLKGYNVTIQQAGAALAVFGDNNLRGAAAGTALRQTVQALAVPAATGQKILQSWGITAGNLSKQLQHGGLTSALDTLQQKMRANGVTAKEQGDALTQIFGKRAGIGLNTLMGELDRFHNKLGEVTKGATGFGSSWAGYTKTFGYALDSAKGAAQALMITLGTDLLPTATKVMKWLGTVGIPDLMKVAHWFQQNKTAAAALGLALVALWQPWVALGVVIVAAYEKSQTFRDVVAAVVKAAGAAFTWLQGVVSNVFTAVQGYYLAHQQQITDLLNQAKATLTALWDAFKVEFGLIADVVRVEVAVIQRVWDTFGHTIVHAIGKALSDAITVLQGTLQTFQGILEVFAGVFTLRWSKIWQGIKDIFGGAFKSLRGTMKGVLDGLSSVMSGAMDAVKAAWHAGWTAMERVFGAISGAIIQGLAGLTQAALSFMGTFVHAASRAFGWVPLVGGHLKSASAAFDSFKSHTVSTLQNLANQAYGMGRHIGDGIGTGLVFGLNEQQRAVATAATALSNTAQTHFKMHAQMSSPSKVFYKYGGWIVQGLVNGIHDNTPAARKIAQYLADGLKIGIEDRAKTLATAIHGTMSQALSALKSGADKMLTQMKSDLSKAQAQVKATLQAMQQLRQSDVQSLTQNAGLADITAPGATSGTSPLDTKITALQAQDAVRQAIAAYMADPTQLNALLVTQAQQSATTASQAVPTTGTSGKLTGKTIVTGLRSDARNLREFIADYHKLQRKGLDGPLLKQILAMGPDQGLPYEKALLADPAAIRQANRYEKSILASSKLFAKSDAEDKYGKQLIEQTKAVKEQNGLIREQNKLLKQLAGEIGSEVGSAMNSTAKAAQHKGKSRAAK